MNDALADAGCARPRAGPPGRRARRRRRRVGDPERAERGLELERVGRDVEPGDDTGPAGGGSSPRSAARRRPPRRPRTTAAARRRAPARRDASGRRQVRRGAAARLALGGLAQLQLEPGHEVLPHRCGPILSLTAARPRLTRLRTTVSDVPQRRGDLGVVTFLDHVGADRVALVGREQLEQRAGALGLRQRLDPRVVLVVELEPLHAHPPPRALLGVAAALGVGELVHRDAEQPRAAAPDCGR